MPIVALRSLPVACGLASWPAAGRRGVYWYPYDELWDDRGITSDNDATDAPNDDEYEEGAEEDDGTAIA